MGADQQLNAGRLRALGLGLSLPADTARVDQIRDAVAEVLTSALTRRKLEALRDEIDALPALDEAIEAVSVLAAA